MKNITSKILKSNSTCTEIENCSIKDFRQLTARISGRKNMSKIWATVRYWHGLNRNRFASHLVSVVSQIFETVFLRLGFGRPGNPTNNKRWWLKLNFDFRFCRIQRDTEIYKFDENFGPKYSARRRYWQVNHVSGNCKYQYWVGGNFTL